MGKQAEVLIVIFLLGYLSLYDLLGESPWLGLKATARRLSLPIRAALEATSRAFFQLYAVRGSREQHG